MTKVAPTQAKAGKVKLPAVEAVSQSVAVIDGVIAGAVGNADPLPPVVVTEGVIATAVGNGELLPPIELAAEVFTHTVKAGPAKGFHRAGKFWTREETKINHADFTDEQWDALEAEPMLTIQQL